MLGFGAGTLETTMGAYVIAQDKNAKGMNILEVFFGLGALLFPFSYLYPYGTICLAFPLVCFIYLRFCARVYVGGLFAQKNPRHCFRSDGLSGKTDCISHI
ncbi:hypothetical protein AAG663_02750 [Bacillus licheniformis]